MSKALKNPLLEDISVWHDRYGENPVEITIPAGEIKEFEEPYFSHLKRYLATAVLKERGAKNHNVPQALKEINEEIEIEL